MTIVVDVLLLSIYGRVFGKELVNIYNDGIRIVLGKVCHRLIS